MSVPTLTWKQVCARRLARHGLLRPLPVGGGAGGGGDGGRSEALAHQAAVVGGIHAQVLTAGELSLARRVEGATRTDVRDALWRHRTLVKAHGLRGTVHLLPAAELGFWLGASAAVAGPRDQAGTAEPFSEEELEAVVRGMGEVLQGTTLTNDAMTEALAEHVGPWASRTVEGGFQGAWPRWRGVVHVAARRGLLVYGPDEGRKVTYTNPRSWLPHLEVTEAGAVLDEVVRRYLHAYGPARPEHLARWLAANVGTVRSRWRTLVDAGELAPVQVAEDDEPAWVLADDTRFDDEVAPADELRLVPYFDAYGIGAAPRPLVFPGRAFERALGGGQAGCYPLLLRNGVVAGVWHQKRAGAKVAITVEPLRPLPKRLLPRLDDEVQRVGEAIEATPTLTIGEIAVGPHA